MSFLVCGELLDTFFHLPSFPSLQMPVTTGHQKIRSMVYRRPRQYIYNPDCQLGHVSPDLSLLVSVCVLMLPVLGLVDEHAQLTTMYHMNPINQWNVHSRHMTFNHTPLVLPSFNNVLTAMVLQNRGARSNIGCPSSHSSTCHVSPSPALTVSFGSWRMVAGMVVVILLLMSGDIEMNPGPVGKCICKSNY